jgi:hypothetical protein
MIFPLTFDYFVVQMIFVIGAVGIVVTDTVLANGTIVNDGIFLTIPITAMFAFMPMTMCVIDMTKFLGILERNDIIAMSVAIVKFAPCVVIRTTLTDHATVPIVNVNHIVKVGTITTIGTWFATIDIFAIGRTSGKIVPA